jgi:hypothetical protein
VHGLSQPLAVQFDLVGVLQLLRGSGYGLGDGAGGFSGNGSGLAFAKEHVDGGLGCGGKVCYSHVVAPLELCNGGGWCDWRCPAAFVILINIPLVY